MKIILFIILLSPSISLAQDFDDGATEANSLGDFLLRSESNREDKLIQQYLKRKKEVQEDRVQFDPRSILYSIESNQDLSDILKKIRASTDAEYKSQQVFQVLEKLSHSQKDAPRLIQVNERTFLSPQIYIPQIIRESQKDAEFSQKFAQKIEILSKKFEEGSTDYSYEDFIFDLSINPEDPRIWNKIIPYLYSHPLGAKIVKTVIDLLIAQGSFRETERFIYFVKNFNPTLAQTILIDTQKALNLVSKSLVTPNPTCPPQIETKDSQKGIEESELAKIDWHTSTLIAKKAIPGSDSFSIFSRNKQGEISFSVISSQNEILQGPISLGEIYNSESSEIYFAQLAESGQSELNILLPGSSLKIEIDTKNFNIKIEKKSPQDPSIKDVAVKLYSASFIEMIQSIADPKTSPEEKTDLLENLYKKNSKLSSRQKEMISSKVLDLYTKGTQEILEETIEKHPFKLDSIRFPTPYRKALTKFIALAPNQFQSLVPQMLKILYFSNKEDQQAIQEILNLLPKNHVVESIFAELEWLKKQADRRPGLRRGYVTIALLEQQMGALKHHVKILSKEQRQIVLWLLNNVIKNNPVYLGPNMLEVLKLLPVDELLSQLDFKELTTVGSSLPSALIRWAMYDRPAILQKMLVNAEIGSVKTKYSYRRLKRFKSQPVIYDLQSQLSFGDNLIQLGAKTISPWLVEEIDKRRSTNQFDSSILILLNAAARISKDSLKMQQYIASQLADLRDPETQKSLTQKNIEEQQLSILAGIPPRDEDTLSFST